MLTHFLGGLQLEFAACVDFTASNGQPHSMTSLHYIDPRQPNQYEMAIRSVLDICQHYNQQKVFEATGFGARIPPNQQANHLFPLVSCKFVLFSNDPECANFFRTLHKGPGVFTASKAWSRPTVSVWSALSSMDQLILLRPSTNLYTKREECPTMEVSTKFC